jgi:hypothetical protein
MYNRVYISHTYYNRSYKTSYFIYFYIFSFNIQYPTPYPPVESQSKKSFYYRAKPGSNWPDRNAEAPGMVGAWCHPQHQFVINILTTTRIILIKYQIVVYTYTNFYKSGLVHRLGIPSL